MPTYKEVKEQVKGLGSVGKLLIRRAEIKELPNILWEGEKIERAITSRSFFGGLGGYQGARDIHK